MAFRNFLLLNRSAAEALISSSSHLPGTGGRAGMHFQNMRNAAGNQKLLPHSNVHTVDRGCRGCPSSYGGRDTP